MEPAIWGFLGVVIGAALTGTAAYFGPIRGARTTAESRMRELEWSARDEEVKQLNELRITAREFGDTLKQARRAQPSERASFSEEIQQRSRAVTMAAYRTTSSGATIPSNHLATPRSGADLAQHLLDPQSGTDQSELSGQLDDVIAKSLRWQQWISMAIRRRIGEIQSDATLPSPAATPRASAERERQ